MTELERMKKQCGRCGPDETPITDTASRIGVFCCWRMQADVYAGVDAAIKRDKINRIGGSDHENLS